MTDIDAIQARADAAMDARDTALYAISYGIGVTDHHWQRADASARDVPALLARVRELEAEREQINQVVTDLRDMCLEVEASGGLFYAPVHRMVALVAEIALRGSGV